MNPGLFRIFILPYLVEF